MSKYQDLNQVTYNAIASKYEEIYGQIPTAIALANKLTTFLNNKKNPKILDLGCGSGSILQIFEGTIAQAELIGVDFSQELLKLAKQKLKKTKLIHQDITEYESSLKFDLIIATFSLIHLTDFELEDTVNKIKAMLNSEAYIYLSFILGNEEKIVKEVLDPTQQVYFNYHSQQEILNLFPSNEFNIVEMVIDEVADEYEVEQDLYLILRKKV
jgi:trans-aconitate methyltransferase